jgi:hypothetical protein
MEAPVLDHTDVRPPPEPPPAVLPPPEPPPETICDEPNTTVTRLTIPQSWARVSTPSPTPRRSLLDGVTYNIPLEKGRPHPKTVDCFP